MSFRPELLKGRAALITGGGTGICRGIARAFAAHGCDVAVMGRRTEPLERTAEELERLGVRTMVAAGDVRQPGAVRDAVDRAAGRFGRLDILVNGAAGNFLCPAETLSPNGFAAVIDIDLKGTFHACRAAFPHLKRQGGVILNISATLHYLGTPAQLHVSAAKAGIDALTRNLAVEWGPYGIRLVGIAPGPVADTEGVRRLLPGGGAERLAGQTPLGRLGTIEDIASAALFLCSDAASFISGDTLVVDGALWLAPGAMGSG